MRFIFLLITLLFSSGYCFASAVSYAGGTTLMQSHNNIFDSVHLHYSASSKYSLGYRFEYLNQKNLFAHSMQVNNLIFRKNAKNYQTNFYIKSGLGLIHSDTQIEPLLYSGLALDWETRRFYASYSNRFYWGHDLFSLINNRYRLGIAPYIANFGDFHTWLMLQIDHNPINDEELIVTPFVRFFVSNYLLELGYSLSESNNVFVNFVWKF